MTNIITGSCCCGDITFKLKDDFSNFYFCHCEQCRKLTGSAHASNLFTSPANITWTNGVDKIKRYDHHERSFSQAFCENCGSGLPIVIENGNALLVPAGSLNEEPTKQLDSQIFCSEQTQWHRTGIEGAKTEGFPE